MAFLTTRVITTTNVFVLLSMLVSSYGQSVWQSVNGTDIGFQPIDGGYYALVTEYNHLLNAYYMDGGIARLGFRYTNEVEALIVPGNLGNLQIEINGKNFSTSYGRVRMFLLEGRISFELENYHDPTYRHFYMGDLPSASLIITTPDLVFRISQPINSRHLSVHVGTHPIHALRCHGVLGQFFQWGDSVDMNPSSRKSAIDGETGDYAVSWIFGIDSRYNLFPLFFPELDLGAQAPPKHNVHVLPMEVAPDQKVQAASLSAPEPWPIMGSTSDTVSSIPSEAGTVTPQDPPANAANHVTPEEHGSGGGNRVIREDRPTGNRVVASAAIVARVKAGLARAVIEDSLSTFEDDAAHSLASKMIGRLQSGRVFATGVLHVQRQDSKVPKQKLFQGLNRRLKIQQQAAEALVEGLDTA